MNLSKLQPLGWSNHFFQQLSLQEIETLNVTNFLFRITAIHRTHIIGIGETGHQSLMVPDELQPVSQFLAVGDWIIATRVYEHFKITGLLEPINRIERVSNDTKQLIAANLDYLWIVTSANDEFNPKRLQRYMAMAYEFNIEPVIILTKTDLCADKYEYIDQITALKVGNYHAVNTADATSYLQLDPYFVSGVSIAMVGSSGVGKSTLINTISDVEQLTKEIREVDAKGKHTTTHRQLFYCKNNVAIIDTPGMRALELLDTEAGLEQTFDDIVDLALRCKFNNCRHQTEPGCAIITAIEQGDMSQTHYDNYLKLLREEAFNKRKTGGAYAEKQFNRNWRKVIKDNKSDKY
ncbi:MAG: ribosome small subunit-dependent GTPase A [Rhizobiales bacterium]|nr:ribosome small subunit-dependent GTPase A [Hyphomicrobiales bacterium]NRB13628.1 ribosome small subunit-dependent GTPase A [Hyphomicrobiales bacterium]